MPRSRLILERVFCSDLSITFPPCQPTNTFHRPHHCHLPIPPPRFPSTRGRPVANPVRFPPTHGRHQPSRTLKHSSPLSKNPSHHQPRLYIIRLPPSAPMSFPNPPCTSPTNPKPHPATYPYAQTFCTHTCSIPHLILPLPTQLSIPLSNPLITPHPLHFTAPPFIPFHPPRPNSCGGSSRWGQQCLVSFLLLDQGGG